MPKQITLFLFLKSLLFLEISVVFLVTNDREFLEWSVHFRWFKNPFAKCIHLLQMERVEDTVVSSVLEQGVS